MLAEYPRSQYLTQAVCRLEVVKELDPRPERIQPAVERVFAT